MANKNDSFFFFVSVLLVIFGSAFITWYFDNIAGYLYRWNTYWSNPQVIAIMKKAWEFDKIKYFQNYLDLLGRSFTHKEPATWNPLVGFQHSIVYLHGLSLIQWVLIVIMAILPLLIIIILVGWLWQNVISKASKKVLRGVEVATSRAEIKRVEKRISRSEPINLYLAEDRFPIPFKNEVMGFMLCGSPRAGKSVSAFDLADQAVSRGDKMIFLDTTGAYIRKYYDPETDIILNPFDARSPGWNIWVDARKDFEVRGIVETLVPRPNSGDPIWADASRTLLFELGKKLRAEGRATINNLIHYSSIAPLDEVHTFLAGTAAATLVDPKSDKTALGIRMNIASYLTTFSYLKDEGIDLFSIKDWILDENRRGRLFFSCRENQLGILKPILTSWIDVTLKSALELSESFERRMWLFLDELPALGKVDSLVVNLAQLPKYGTVPVLGIQSMAQLRDIYGRDKAESLSSVVQNWLIFRTSDPELAEMLSRQIGRQEIERIKTTDSNGKQGTTTSTTKDVKEELAILPSEIQNLEERTCYLNLAGPWPVVKLTFPIINRPDRADGFKEATDADVSKPVLPQEQTDLDAITLA